MSSNTMLLAAFLFAIVRMLTHSCLLIYPVVKTHYSIAASVVAFIVAGHTQITAATQIAHVTTDDPSQHP